MTARKTKTPTAKAGAASAAKSKTKTPPAESKPVVSDPAPPWPVHPTNAIALGAAAALASHFLGG